MRAFKATILSLALSWSVSAAAQSVSVGVLDDYTTRPTDTSVTYNDVYGVVSFSSDLRSEEGIRNFMNTLVSQKFGSNAEGNFVVTLAVSTGASDKPLAERPILTASRKERKFLWITTQESTTGQIDISGTLLNGIIVNNSVNRLRVALKVYKSDKVTIDTKSYTDLLKLADQARLAASLVEIPELITGNSDSIKNILTTALSRESSQELALASEMAFIAVNGLPKQPPNKLRFRVRSTSPSVNHVFSIEVRFDTLPSAFIYDTAKVPTGYKGFSDWAKPGAFLQRASIELGAAKIRINDMLQRSGPKEVAAALTTLTRSAYDRGKNGDIPIHDICNRIFDLLGNAYTERDTVGIYWDILHSLKIYLSQTAEAKECVEGKKEMFVRHGLKIDALASINK